MIPSYFYFPQKVKACASLVFRDEAGFSDFVSSLLQVFQFVRCPASRGAAAVLVSLLSWNVAKSCC